MVDNAELVGPYFICIGAQKAGTRWLYNQLEVHQDIWMPPVKELHFFDGHFNLKEIQEKLDEFSVQNDESGKSLSHSSHPYTAQSLAFLKRAANYDSHTSDLDWYRELFRRKRPRVTGEITPRYSALDEDTVKQVCNGLLDTKFLFIVRDPVERLWSQLCMMLRKSTGQLDLTDSQTIDWLIATEGVVSRSFPTRTFHLWSRNLASDKFRVFFFDDLVRSPGDYLSDVFDYLEVDPDRRKLNRPINFYPKSKDRKVDMSDEIRETLIASLRDELERCVEVFGGPAHDWAAKYGIGQR